MKNCNYCLHTLQLQFIVKRSFEALVSSVRGISRQYTTITFFTDETFLDINKGKALLNFYVERNVT